MGDVVDIDPRLGRDPEAVLLVVDDHDVARDLELGVVGVGGSGNLIHDAGVPGVGNVEDADAGAGEPDVAAEEVVIL